MENRAKAAGVKLSRSTAYRICVSRQAPATSESLEAFLVACQVVPRDRDAWHKAWLRAQHHAHRSDQSSERLEETKRLETVVADNLSGKVPADTAGRLLRRAGFESLERYRGFEKPWSVMCVHCGATLRLRLSDAVMGQATCVDCPRVSDQVHEAWAELLRNGSGALPREYARVLRTVTVLSARLRGGHLDVPLFVPDRDAALAVQSVSWHPAFNAVLRRHVRRSFRLNVLLVQDYDTVDTRRAGQRQRRIAKAEGLAVGPLEPPCADSGLSERATRYGPEWTAHETDPSPAPVLLQRTARSSHAWQAVSNSGP
ncbi:hypothetical protein K5X85_36010 (plasmid) [Streptomyces sp. A144]|uniref:hypothetical protein n=1 Tax=Streptomyces sp. A144 TaxID=2871487 RepID=UPI001CC144CD|nr:hypothetical protein [Streptomyces sp. A144]